jgi:glutamine phosphoribosylpyrophosphate amidotransferase
LRLAVEDTDDTRHKFCTSCYTGSYPTELVQLEVEAHREG